MRPSRLTFPVILRCSAQSAEPRRTTARAPRPASFEARPAGEHLRMTGNVAELYCFSRPARRFESCLITPHSLSISACFFARLQPLIFLSTAIASTMRSKCSTKQAEPAAAWTCNRDAHRTDVRRCASKHRRPSRRRCKMNCPRSAAHRRTRPSSLRPCECSPRALFTVILMMGFAPRLGKY
jgi:hypothetical protein